MIYLETERIQLREIRREDAPLLLELDSDPEVMTYLTDGVPSTAVDIHAAIERILALKTRYQGRFGLWAAIEKSGGEFIGWFHFRPCKKRPEDLKTVELGYRLKKKFWGQGFAPEVSKALIAKGFTELGVEKVFATTMAKNQNSRRVMEKVGLTQEYEYLEELFPGIDKRAVRYSLIR